jgi:hypothetical protein
MRLDAAIWQQFVTEGQVRCASCDEFVDLDDAETINEGVELWNEHVEECGNAEGTQTTFNDL